MRTTSVFILMIVIFGAYFYGYTTLHAMGTVDHPEGTTGLDPLSNGSSPFVYFMEFNETAGALGEDANTTVLSELMEWDLAGAAVEVLDATGVNNLANYMITFINLLAGFVTAPFVLLEVTGLSGITPLFIIPVALVALAMLAIWQIITGRNV